MGHSITIQNYNFPDGIYSLEISYNLSSIYKDAMAKIGYGDKALADVINGKKLSELKDFFIKLRNELEGNPTYYKKYEPENGWGSYNGLLQNLGLLIIASNEVPDNILEDFY